MDKQIVKLVLNPIKEGVAQEFNFNRKNITISIDSQNKIYAIDLGNCVIIPKDEFQMLMDITKNLVEYTNVAREFADKIHSLTPPEITPRLRPKE